jgi:hypothetical protein
MIQNDIVDTAWGAPLKPEVKSLASEALAPVPKFIIGSMVQGVTDNLTKLCDMIEGDIEYFNKYLGQAMAVNRLAMIKYFIKNEIKALQAL